MSCNDILPYGSKIKPALPMRLAETRILVYRTSLYVKSFPRSNVKTSSLMKMMKVCFTLETFEKSTDSPRGRSGNFQKLFQSSVRFVSCHTHCAWRKLSKESSANHSIGWKATNVESPRMESLQSQLDSTWRRCGVAAFSSLAGGGFGHCIYQLQSFASETKTKTRGSTTSLCKLPIPDKTNYWCILQSL